MKKSLLLAALLIGTLPGLASAAPPATAQRLRVAQEQRQALASELDALARRIEARKAAARASVLPDRELEGLLQRSQALAADLARLHREEESARTAHRTELERQLRERESEFRTARAQGNTDRIATAEAERTRLRSELDAMQPQAGATVGLPSAPGDDPEDVRELADLLRDQRDRVLARLALVEQRLAEAREEAHVARELRDFVDESNLFDDGERVMRASRTVTRSTGSGGESEPSPTEGAPGRGPVAEPTDVDGHSGPFVPGDDLTSGGPPPAPVGGGSGGGPTTTTSTLVGTRPLGSGDITARALPALDGDESIGELVEQQEALRELAGQLERKASELDRRARRYEAPGSR